VSAGLVAKRQIRTPTLGFKLTLVSLLMKMLIIRFVH